VASDDGGARTGRSGDFVFRTDPLTPWVPADHAGRFQVGLFGVPGWDDTGAFNLASLYDPLRTRFTRFYAADMTYEADWQILQYLREMRAGGRSAFVDIDSSAIKSGTSQDLVNIKSRVNEIKADTAGYPAV